MPNNARRATRRCLRGANPAWHMVASRNRGQCFGGSRRFAGATRFCCAAILWSLWALAVLGAVNASDRHDLIGPRVAAEATRPREAEPQVDPTPADRDLPVTRPRPLFRWFRGRR